MELTSTRWTAGDQVSATLARPRENAGRSPGGASVMPSTTGNGRHAAGIMTSALNAAGMVRCDQAAERGDRLASAPASLHHLGVRGLMTNGRAQAIKSRR